MDEVKLTRDDIEPLMEGVAILGTGGGGNPDWGRMIMENDLDRGRTWTVMSLDAVPDNWTIVCGGIMGSVKSLEEIGFDVVLKNWETSFALIEVTRYMEKLLGKKINAMVPFEAGGLNTPIVLTLAARMEIAAIDADALGRSAPETQMTSWHGHGVEITPMPLADSMGNIVVVSRASTPTYIDEVGRFVVTKGGYLGANNHHPMSGKTLKATSVPGTFSRSLALGKSVLEARSSGGDPIATVVKALSAYHLIHARIETLCEEERMGFYFTTVGLKGMGEDLGKEARLVIKNEAMACFLDEKPVTIFPDPIYMLEPGSGRGYMSVELKEGMELVVLAAPAHPRLREAAMSERGREAFSPSRYGEADLVYTPLETLMGEK
jgi:DUF917 family protein